jgi:uncharacterized protein with HEPN domain
MPKKRRDIELFIVDVLVAIQKIKAYTKPFENEEDFHHSSLHWDATIRQLEVIGEALNNLLDDEKFNAVAPKYFRKIVNFRNAIVHGYFGIDVDEVWNIITEKLAVLEIDIMQIIKQHIDITDAIQAEILEYQQLNETSIEQYLNSLL